MYRPNRIGNRMFLDDLVPRNGIPIANVASFDTWTGNAGALIAHTNIGLSGAGREYNMGRIQQSGTTAISGLNVGYFGVFVQIPGTAKDRGLLIDVQMHGFVYFQDGIAIQTIVGSDDNQNFVYPGTYGDIVFAKDSFDIIGQARHDPLTGTQDPIHWSVDRQCIIGVGGSTGNDEQSYAVFAGVRIINFSGGNLDMSGLTFSVSLHAYFNDIPIFDYVKA